MTKNTANGRNQTLECLKLFAAFFIVYAHVGLPGIAGTLVDCLFRFSLPLFFSISGYYSFNARGDKLSKRFRHILRLFLIAVVVQTVWGCIFSSIKGEDALEFLRDAVPSVKEFANLVFLHLDSMLGHLWYLAAAAGVYAVMIVYVRFFGDDPINYTPLYMVSVALLMIRFAGADLMRKAGLDVPYYLLRDGWFFGIPMFAMGLFIRQYQQRLIDNYHLTTKRLWALLAFGIALSLLQHTTFGTSQLPFGAVIQAFAMFMLALRHPRADFGHAPLEKLISTFATLSTTVYISQFCVYDAYAYWISTPLYALLGYKERFIRPLIIALGGCVVGLALHCAVILGKKQKAK